MAEGTTPVKSLEDFINDLQKQLDNEKAKKDLALAFILSLGKRREFQTFCESPEGLDSLKH